MSTFTHPAPPRLRSRKLHPSPHTTQHPQLSSSETFHTMLDTTDLVILILVTFGTIAYFTKGRLWAKPVQVGYGYGTGKATANGVAKPKKTRNIVKRMEQQNKNVVVFFASQTGTAGMSLLRTIPPKISCNWLISFSSRRGLFFTPCERRTFSIRPQNYDCRS